MTSPSQRARQCGFTLLEIMIALAVFATLSAALMSANQFVLNQSSHLENRLFAAWLADNHLNDLQLQTRPISSAERIKIVSFAGRDWRLTQRVSPLPNSTLLSIEVSVVAADSRQAVSTLTRWIPARHE